MTETVFNILAVFAILCAIACIVQRNPVASAIWLVGTMLALAGIYVLLNAHFVGAIQVLVYTGAIMVLFLFVIMLLNLDQASPDIRGWGVRLLAVAFVAALLGPLVPLGRYTPHRLAAEVTGAASFGDPSAALPAGQAALAATAEKGVVGAVAVPLFQQYLIPFEITSVLLLTAAVGAVVIAKRKL